MTIEAVNIDLRTIKRLDGESWTVVRMIELKKGDIFKMFEMDNVIVGDLWIATTDAYPDPKNEGLGAVQAEAYTRDAN